MSTAQATSVSSIQLVVFTLGGEEYAVGITDVHEIIRYTKPRSMPSTDPAQRGVINLRGKVIPVYALADKLGAVVEESDDTKIVVVDADGVITGVIVDEVTEVLTVSSDQIEPAPGRAAAVQSIVKVDDRLLGLVDVGALFQPEGSFDLLEFPAEAEADGTTAAGDQDEAQAA